METLERFGDGVEEYGIVFRIPAGDVRLELVTRAEARSLVLEAQTDLVAGLRIGVPDADAAWSATRLAGLRHDGSCADGPADTPFGRLVRSFTPGGLRIDFVQSQILASDGAPTPDA